MNLQPGINEKDQKQGNEQAPLTLVEYGDYQCPYCGEAYPIVKELQRHFGDKLLFVFRNFPLTEIHPQAYASACVAEASGLQNKFWPVHDLIFENQKRLWPQQLLSYASSAGANIEKLGADMESEQILGKIDADFESGVRSGVNGTPTFFINGQRHGGKYAYEILKAALEEQLQEQ